MKSSEYGGWQMVVFWLAIAIAALIIGFSIGWAWRDVDDARATVDLALQVMIAFGTVGAVIAAVAVPLYQNWDRRREQEHNQLLTDWALAEEMNRISARLKDIAKSLSDPSSLPSEAEIVHLQSQLGIAKQGMRDRVGRLIVDGLLSESVAIFDGANRRSALLKTAGSIGVAVFNSASRKATDDRARRLAALHEQTYRWMERVLAQFDAMGIPAPGVVKGSGEASIGVSASGEGRTQSQS